MSLKFQYKNFSQFYDIEKTDTFPFYLLKNIIVRKWSARKLRAYIPWNCVYRFKELIRKGVVMTLVLWSLQSIEEFPSLKKVINLSPYIFKQEKIKKCIESQRSLIRHYILHWYALVLRSRLKCTWKGFESYKVLIKMRCKYSNKNCSSH